MNMHVPPSNHRVCYATEVLPELVTISGKKQRYVCDPLGEIQLTASPWVQTHIFYHTFFVFSQLKRLYSINWQFPPSHLNFEPGNWTKSFSTAPWIEHLKIGKIAKFGGEMLWNMENIAVWSLRVLYNSYIAREKPCSFRFKCDRLSRT